MSSYTVYSRYLAVWTWKFSRNLLTLELVISSINCCDIRRYASGILIPVLASTGLFAETWLIYLITMLYGHLNIKCHLAESEDDLW